MSPSRHRDQFTFIELAISLGLVVFIAVGVLAAIRPQDSGSFERNAQRIHDLHLLQTILTTCLDAEECALSPSIGSTPLTLCRLSAVDCSSGIRLRFSSPDGAPALLPQDPHAPLSGTGTAYTLRRTGSGMVLSAPLAEDGIVLDVLIRE